MYDRSPASALHPVAKSVAQFRDVVPGLAAVGLLTALVTGCGGSQALSVQPPPSGDLVVSSASVSFGSVGVGKSGAVSLTVSNNGTGSLQISQVAFSSAAFSQTATLPITIAAGQSSSLPLAFAPSATGAASASMTITNSGSPGTVNVSLSGTGVPDVPGLQVQSASVDFGDVLLNTPATQSVTLTSSGIEPLTISSATVAGSGFTVAGLTLPATLNPTQTATLDIAFDPAGAGSVTGSVTLATNAPSGSSAIALSGIGVTAIYRVNLTWQAPPATPDPVSGYNLYRSTNGGAYSPLARVTSTSYTDASVLNGTTYSWYVMSVDAQGIESPPSNVFTVTIPN